MKSILLNNIIEEFKKQWINFVQTRSTDNFITLAFWNDEIDFESIKKEWILKSFWLTGEEVKYFLSLDKNELEQIKKLIQIKKLKLEINKLEKEII
jgi:hypothetical protein